MIFRGKRKRNGMPGKYNLPMVSTSSGYVSSTCRAAKLIKIDYFNNYRFLLLAFEFAEINTPFKRCPNWFFI